MPSRFTPRRINGNTVVLSVAPPAKPQDATLPPLATDRSTPASVSPPALSIAPAQRSDSNGRLDAAATTLRPAGKARFGEDYLDVIAEGDYVNPGSRVQVIEIEGNRIVVKEV